MVATDFGNSLHTSQVGREARPSSIVSFFYCGYPRGGYRAAVSGMQQEPCKFLLIGLVIGTVGRVGSGCNGFVSRWGRCLVGWDGYGPESREGVTGPWRRRIWSSLEMVTWCLSNSALHP
jgi:hypothetical protein